MCEEQKRRPVMSRCCFIVLSVNLLHSFETPLDPPPNNVRKQQHFRNEVAQ